MKVKFLLLCGLLMGCFSLKAQNKEYQKAFERLEKQFTRRTFYDDFQTHWLNKWHMDGRTAKVEVKDGTLKVCAGNRAYVDEDHVVLWTRKEFEGDLKIEYDFTRCDSSKYYFVNILYIQAQGSGEGPYKRDIFEWNELRDVPAMDVYFNHMETYHISYAVTGTEKPNEKEYIRARRYMPQNKKGLKGTDLRPEYFETGLFKIGVPYHLTFIKSGTDIYMNVKGDGREETFYFDASNFPKITKGRIGLRQMFTRTSSYQNFQVFQRNK